MAQLTRLWSLLATHWKEYEHKDKVHGKDKRTRETGTHGGITGLERSGLPLFEVDAMFEASDAF